MFIKEYPELGHIEDIKSELPLGKKLHYVRLNFENKHINLLLTDSDISKAIYRYQNNIGHISSQIKIKTKLGACVWISIYASIVTSVLMGLLIKYMG